MTLTDEQATDPLRQLLTHDPIGLLEAEARAACETHAVLAEVLESERRHSGELQDRLDDAAYQREQAVKQTRHEFMAVAREAYEVWLLTEPGRVGDAAERLMVNLYRLIGESVPGYSLTGAGDGH